MSPNAARSRIEFTGDDDEVQKGELDAWPLVVAVRPGLERSRRHGLNDFRPFSAGFSRKFDDLRLGVDRLSAFGVYEIRQLTGAPEPRASPRPIVDNLSESLLARFEPVVNDLAAAG